MSGRIAVRNGQQNDIARLRWTHARASDRWVIATPLGNEVARIESDAQGATLEQAGGSPQRAPSFAALTQQLLGVTLEPAELAAWLHGTPPQAAGGWTVTLDERQAAGQVEIARRVTATRGEVTVRLVVDDYRALPEQALLPGPDYLAPAKLNLFLHVVGRRPDGYHLLQSAFTLIDRCDTIRLRVRDDGAIRRVSDLPGVPAEQDLVVRAARLLQEASGTRLGAEIEVEERIP